MNPFRWIRMRKKSLPDLPLEPPIWLGNKSNGEYYHEQTDYDRRLREAILKKADEKARRIGWGRREFLASSMGMATSLWVINQMGCGQGDENQTAGPYNIPPDAMTDGDAAGACTTLDPAKEFIFDLQTHHVNPMGPWRQTNSVYSLFLGALPQSSLCAEMGIECFSAKYYIEQMFINSDTTMSCLSSIPAQPCINVMTACDTPLRNNEIAGTRDLVNSQLAKSQRMVNHCMVMPNLDQMQQWDEMAAMHSMFGVAAWKCYTPWGPNQMGWWLDDPAIGIPFIEKGLEIGVPIFCCHKGFPLPTFDSIHTDPKDIGVVANMYPNAKFIVYHSAYQHGGNGPEGVYDPADYHGVNSLLKTLEDNNIGVGSNVYAELGSLWGNIMNSPVQAQHVIGKLLKHVGEDNVVWGTDCIWTGSPQSQIDAFRAFTITPQFQMMYGYPELTDAIKRKIFGLNAAKVFGVDPDAQRCAISQTDLEHARLLLDSELGPNRWAFDPPAGPRTRQEFFDFIRANEGQPG